MHFKSAIYTQSSEVLLQEHAWLVPLSLIGRHSYAMLDNKATSHIILHAQLSSCPSVVWEGVGGARGLGVGEVGKDRGKGVGGGLGGGGGARD